MSIETGYGLFYSVFPVLTAAAGFLFSQYSENKKRESEEKRWYIDHLLDRKIDSFVTLYSSLQDCFLSVTLYKSHAPGEFDNYGRKQEVYISSLSNAAIYLTHDEFQAMYDFLTAYIQAKDAIYYALPTSDDSIIAKKQSLPPEVLIIDRGRLNVTFREAMDTLRKHIHPVILKQISHKYNSN